MTLNLMRESKRSPKLSSWADVRGPYDFNRNPIAPAGTRVTVYENPNIRGTWDPHGVRGYYLGPALDHYRCHKVLVEKTKRTRITDSLAWHPEDRITKSDVTPNIDGVVGAIEQHSISNPKRRHRDRIKKKTTSTGAAAREEVDDAGGETHQAVTPPQRAEQTVDPSTSVTEESQPDGVAAEPTASQPSVVEPRSSLRRKTKNHQIFNKQFFTGLACRKKCSHLYDQLHFAGLTYKKACKGPEKGRWEQAACEEFHRLLIETQTMQLIAHDRMDSERRASYYNPQTRIKVKSDGSIEYRVRGTYGGNISDYDGPKSANTADMVSVKILMNVLASTAGARFMTADIKDFYLGTPMERKEYMKIKIDQFPEEARALYIREELVKDGHVLAEISKGIYGLAQAGRLAQERLLKHLEAHDYIPISPLNPCMFKHKSRDITFSLVVDDFGVVYKNEEDVEHMLTSLRELYKVKEDWVGSSYVGYHIVHDQEKNTVTLSMPGYVEAAKQRFEIYPDEVVENPFDESAAPDNEESTPATEQQRKRIQQIIGVLLYYSRAVDPTMLVRINKAASRISTATVDTMKAAERILRYVICNPDASITYHRSKMVLILYSDASYLTERGSRSRCGGFFFLGDNDSDWRLNGAVLCNSKIIDVVVSSAAESEYAAAYMNAKEAAYMRETLEALGFPQQQTPIISDNAFICKMMTGEFKSKKVKAMDMRFEWLRERASKGQYVLRWNERALNIADYFTKDLKTDEYKRTRKFVIPSRDVRVTSLDIASAMGGGQYGKGSRIQDGSIVDAPMGEREGSENDICELRGVCCSVGEDITYTSTKHSDTTHTDFPLFAGRGESKLSIAQLPLLGMNN